MKKNIIFLSFAIMITMLSFTAAGQVKQIFLFKDAVTDKPLENVKLNIVGENEVISNAKGVAVMVSSTKKTGEEYFVKSVTKDGYMYLGRSWKSSANYPLISKDTAEYLLCSTEEYRKVSNLYYSAMLKSVYKETNEYFDRLNQALKENPADYDDIAFEFLSVGLIRDVVNSTYDMPSVRSIMRLPQKIRQDCEDLIAKGENRKAIDLIESRIKENDLSEENLMTVDYYLRILDLEPEYQNSIDLAPFYRLLARKRETETENYLWAVSNSKEFDMTTEYPLWKDKLKTERSKIGGEFCYNLVLAGEDEAKAEECVKRLHKNMEALNENKATDDDLALASQYSRFSSVCLAKGDTAQALTYRNKMFKCFETVKAYNDIERIRYNNEFARLTLNSGGTLAKDTIREKEISAWLDGLLQTDFELDSSLLIARIPYIVLSNLQMNADKETKEDYLARLKEHEFLIKGVEKDCEGYFLRDLWGLKYTEMSNAVDYDNMYKNWQEIIDYNKRINAICPDVLLISQYKVNQEFLRYAKYYGTEQQVKEVIESNDNLLKIVEKYDKLYSYYYRAQNNNDMAEYLYSIQEYDKAKSYYDKEIEYRTLAAQEDSTLWYYLATVYLQAGDAYAYTKDYAKAIEMYSKVNDLEGKITSQERNLYNLDKVSAVYFTGDIYRMQKEYKKALKYFNDAENGYKQLSKEGSDVNQSLAEMYYSLQAVWYSLGNKKKSFEDLKSAYDYYKKANLNSISQKYVAVQRDLLDAYAERKDWENYYMIQFNLLGTYQNYSEVNKNYLYPYSELCFSVAGDIKNEGLYSDAIKFYKQTADVLDTIKSLGGEINYPTYLRSNYQIADCYYYAGELGSSAMYYNKCLELNKAIKDTNEKLFYTNNYLVDLQLMDVYEAKSELDTINKEKLTLNDTLAVQYLEDAAANLQKLDLTNNIELKYKLAAIKQHLGYKYRWFSRFNDALEVLQQSNDLAMQFNAGNTKDAAQNIIAYNHVLIGGIYDNHDRQQAKKEYYKTLNIYDNASKDAKKDMEKYRGMAAERILDILIYDDVMKDTKEINKMKKIVAEVKKKTDKE